MSEQVVSTSGTTWHDFIQADGQIVAEKFSGATAAMAYFALDDVPPDMPSFMRRVCSGLL